MSKRRTWIGVIVIAAVVVAAFLILKVFKTGTGDESETIVPDVAVHVGKITRATLHGLVTAYGTVEPERAAAGRVPADAEVASPVAGVVAHVDCVEGQRVAKGDVLFRLDSRVADVAYEKAKKASAFAEATFDRQKKLLPVEGTSKKAYLEAEQALAQARSELASAETDLALLKIQAPLSGTVIKINSEPGEAVELNTVLAKIIDLGRLVATVSVPSREAALVKVGQPVRFEVAEAETGKVIYVGSQIDDKSDSLPVRISLPAGPAFHPGQFLSVRVVTEERADCLAVPEAAVISDPSGGGAIMLVEGEKAVRKAVKIGLREAGLVEVSGDGLKEGAPIVLEEAYSLPAETKIRILGK
jgi:membrane fusion protein (multidrug efflux system)